MSIKDEIQHLLKLVIGYKNGSEMEFVLFRAIAHNAKKLASGKNY